MGCKSIRKTSGLSEPCLYPTLYPSYTFPLVLLILPLPIKYYSFYHSLYILPTLPSLPYPSLPYPFSFYPAHRSLFSYIISYFPFYISPLVFLFFPSIPPCLSLPLSLSVLPVRHFPISLVIYSFLDLLLFAHFIFSFSSDHKFPQCS